MPLEAVPVVGAGVIVGVTALELYDACETMKDMADIRRPSSSKTRFFRIVATYAEQKCHQTMTFGP